MEIFVFGNPDENLDNRPFEIIRNIEKNSKQKRFSLKSRSYVPGEKDCVKPIGMVGFEKTAIGCTPRRSARRSTKVCFFARDVVRDKEKLNLTNKQCFHNLDFIIIPPNSDLPIRNHLYIMDTVAGIEKITLISEKDLDKILLIPRGTVHDYDLGFQLRYLTKIGKIKHFTIIGIPQVGELDYDSVHSTLRKLVAQDIQGS